jgi:membrane protein
MEQRTSTDRPAPGGEVVEEPGDGRGGGAPEGPTDIRGKGWWATLKRTAKEFREDDLTDWAAALTYYGVLALFPALLVLVSILGLIGSSAIQPMIDNLGAVAPGPAQEIITGALENLQRSQGTAGLLFVVGILGALWSASGYVGAFTRASNAIYEVEEGRPFWKLRPLQIGITVVMILMIAACAIAVVVSGPLAEQVGNVVGAGDAAVTVWDIAKWPVIALVVMTMFALLYWLAPNVKQPGFRWLSPGGAAAVVLWLLTSAAFAFYVANFSSYNETYGAIGGVIAFLTWLWITNLAILFGAELNAEVAREREIEARHPAEEEPFLEPRETKKRKQG